MKRIPQPILEERIEKFESLRKHPTFRSLPCGEQDAAYDEYKQLIEERDRRANLSTPYAISTEKRPESLLEALRELAHRYPDKM